MTPSERAGAHVEGPWRSSGRSGWRRGWRSRRGRWGSSGPRPCRPPASRPCCRVSAAGHSRTREGLFMCPVPCPVPSPERPFTVPVPSPGTTPLGPHPIPGNAPSRSPSHPRERRSRALSHPSLGTGRSRSPFPLSPFPPSRVPGPAADAAPVPPAGRDCLGCAKTGSGKTAAFVLPVLQVLSEDPYGIFCLVLTPTRYRAAPESPGRVPESPGPAELSLPAGSWRIRSRSSSECWANPSA